MLAMNPTPQESFSRLGSYMPSAGGRQLCSRGPSVSAGFEAAVADSKAVPMFSRSNSDPLISILLTRLRPPASPAPLGRSRHPPGHRSSSASRDFLNSGLGVQRPERTALPALPWSSEHPDFVAIPVPGRLVIETVILS